ncbi:MAG: tRNA threonylcarbamoyladenosine dehydratase [Spirochaetaceae bacterium]|nr:tRNA threonylcarbamoyladenosine dehydratase [Spirochaetaceae bacterium]
MNEINEEFERMARILDSGKIETLKSKHVAVFGIGGVGSFAAEALARASIGFITLVDNDTVAASNINRQLIALHSTISKPKTEIMKSRILDINPSCCVEALNIFYGKETENLIDFSKFDAVIDAVDTVSAKLLIIENAKKAGIDLISCMGTGNKLDPTRFEIADISKTSVCPLARVMRYELKKRRISKVPVVYSKEEPIKSSTNQADSRGKIPPGSISFVPPVAGMIAASYIINQFLK